MLELLNNIVIVAGGVRGLIAGEEVIPEGAVEVHTECVDRGGQAPIWKYCIALLYFTHT